MVRWRKSGDCGRFIQWFSGGKGGDRGRLSGKGGDRDRSLTGDRRGGLSGDRGRGCQQDRGGGLNFLTGDAGGVVQIPPATAPATAVDTLGTAPAAAGTAPATAVPVFDVDDIAEVSLVTQGFCLVNSHGK